MVKRIVAVFLLPSLVAPIDHAECGRAHELRGCALSPSDIPAVGNSSAAAKRAPLWWLHAPKTGSSWCTVSSVGAPVRSSLASVACASTLRRCARSDATPRSPCAAVTAVRAQVLEHAVCGDEAFDGVEHFASASEGGDFGEPRSRGHGPAVTLIRRVT